MKVVGFGEVMLRLSSRPPALLLQEPWLEASFGGAEANVLVGLAGFGHDATIVTAVPDNTLGERAASALRQLGCRVAGPVHAGCRLGLLFLEPGAMARPSRVIYDRAGSAFAAIEPGAIDWIAELDGADWLVVSGITAALGDGPLAELQAAFDAARAAGTKIAFDTNFRPSLWRQRESQAAEILRTFAAQCDLLFAGRRAIGLILGARFEQSDPTEGFAAAAAAMFAQAPSLSWIAATRRMVMSTSRHELCALVAELTGVTESPLVVLENIVDRVGTGDAFATGVIHALSSGMSREDAARFALACSQWAHSVPGDFMRADLSDITVLLAGTGDVRR